MNRFDELWANAAATTGDGLLVRGATAEDARELTALLRCLHFAGAVSLLGSGEDNAPLGNDLLGTIAAAPPVREHGAEAAALRRVLSALLVHRTTGADLLADEDLLALLADATASALPAHGIPIRPDEAAEAIDLLASGELFRDLGAATAAILRTIPQLPLTLVSDLPRTPFRLVRLAQAVALDLPGSAAQVPAVVVDLLDGRLDQPPGLMTHTLRWLYETATVRSTLVMIRSLIAPDNASVRLAIVLYARANGIPLQPGDLDTLSATVLNSDNPDLGPALAVAVDRLRQRYPQTDLEHILQRMSG
jgi:hypothetical protein